MRSAIEKVVARLQKQRERRERRAGYRPVEIELHYRLHADGSVSQYWPGDRTRPDRRVGDAQLVVEAVAADYQRLLQVYRTRKA